MPYDTLTSDYGSDDRRLQVVDTPYRQAMQSNNLDAASQSNVLQRFKRQVLHFGSTTKTMNNIHQTDKNMPVFW